MIEIQLHYISLIIQFWSVKFYTLSYFPVSPIPIMHISLPLSELIRMLPSPSIWGDPMSAPEETSKQSPICWCFTWDYAGTVFLHEISFLFSFHLGVKIKLMPSRRILLRQFHCVVTNGNHESHDRWLLFNYSQNIK